MSSDEADSKVEKMNDMENKGDESKSGDENEVAAEPTKANNKGSKKKAAAAPKIKAPAKKRAKEAEKEVEKNSKEEEKKKDSKKKVEESDEDEADDEENDQENGDQKDVPLLDQPLEITGSRERKQVQRFTVPKVESEEQKNIVIPEGKGKPLGEIPRIENQLQRYKFESLKPLHRICFNRVGKSTMIKKNIRNFCGYEFDKDSPEYGKKKSMLSKFNLNELRTVCSILDLERSKKKEDLVDGILTFMLNPEDSGKPLPEARSKRRSATLKTYDEESDSESGSKKKKSPKGKGKKKSQKEESDSEEEINDLNTKGEEEAEESKTDNESDDEVFETPELNGTYVLLPKVNRRKATDETFVVASKAPPKKKVAKKAPAKAKEKKAAPPPKKRAAAKKAASKKKEESEGEDEADKSESGGESDEDDAPLSKKGKNPPTDDDIKAYVKSILDGANLEEITMKTVCKQVYSHYPEFDLGHKKDFIKATVKSLISS